ncbi:hypothetical protein EON63_03210 [archaeon]|nr:MAG: hypothetical protein EON63_03210 [archaeon]
MDTGFSSPEALHDLDEVLPASSHNSMIRISFPNFEVKTRFMDCYLPAFTLIIQIMYVFDSILALENCSFLLLTIPHL